MCHLPIEKMAGATRLELATSGVTGQRSNQLSYAPAICEGASYAKRLASSTGLDKKSDSGNRRQGGGGGEPL